MKITNVDKLVKISISGEIANPGMPPLPASPYLISAEGEPILIPAYGGLVYNVQIGDRAVGWAAELIQAGVSIKNNDGAANTALGTYACIGNQARIVSGMASGVEGVVTGKSGRFADHVICHFNKSDLEKMSPGDKVLVKAFGVGLRFIDFPEVDIKSCDPGLLEKLQISIQPDGLTIPVKCVVPNRIIGAGSGFQSESKVLNLQMTDLDVRREARLDDLRFGDLVAVQDWDSRFTHGYLRGFTAIGIVSQGDSVRSGYGPGITIIMTGSSKQIKPEIVEEANIAQYLGLL